MAETWAVGFAGPGELDQAAIAALLDDWLPEDDLTVYMPDKIGRSAKGMKAVRSWMETVEQEYEASEAIVASLQTSGADKQFLVLLWGEEGDADAETLLEAAIGAGIPVKDLTHALDDLMIESESVPSEGEEIEDTSVADAKAAMERDPDPVSELVLDEANIEVGKDYTEVNRINEMMTLKPAASQFEEVQDVVTIAMALEEFVRGIVQAEIAIALAPKPVGRPRTHVEDDEEVSVIFDEDTQEYMVAGRGRPKKGQQRIKMTKGEARAKGVIFPDLEDTPF